ncbi:hydantoinase/oxoprolinase family protein [Youngiibacter fragilis]|uniref:Hydantoin utilization protein A n=1 Tax=Youngiibacter fragilis 232.1 TaxID=994573 RepID=V7I7W7_9CLOT|nr:hydantoinase/oxoprolinase family protein [Youngiibacter fragilis]ETA81371.1 hydantoin utilization protein A [Youngiibacter fragilis 232.1]
MSYMLGVDVGGTFTDFSLYNTDTKEIRNFKRSSTPDDPSRAIVSGIIQILEECGIAPDEVSFLGHGTTVATNALIEKKGARTGLITTYGFKDLMEIGNQKRPSLYNLLKDKSESLIVPGCKCEVRERIMHDGTVKLPLNEEDVRNAVSFLKEQKVDSIAVCTLFSFINPVHEKRIKEIISEEFPEAYVTISSELVNEFREYPRMSTTVLNSYLGPVMKKYVRNFENSVKEVGIDTKPYVTQSNGSIISIAETIDYPIKTAVSGPSAGAVGASYLSGLSDEHKIITFDMGGTSADISLIQNGKLQVSYDRYVEGYPARVPMIDIITVGAGGGSIAKIDEGGAMKVGPRSAGAVPGPACYMRGGQEPTVTDANIMLGKLNRHKILGGKMDVDRSLAESAIKKKLSSESGLDVIDAAAGIISVVNSNMVRAIRGVSIERGYDPREFILMAFGGAGPLHACEVAAELGISKVLLPGSPGTLCSLGLLMADTRFDLSRSRIMLANKENLKDIRRIFTDLKEEGDQLLENEGVPSDMRKYVYSLDCRYENQNYEISMEIADGQMDDKILSELIEGFHAEHNNSYGYFDRNKNIQLVNYRMGAIGIIDKPTIPGSDTLVQGDVPVTELRQVRYEGSREFVETRIIQRDSLKRGTAVEGPAIIEQMDSTCVIPPGWTAYNDRYGNLIVTHEGGEA